MLESSLIAYAHYLSIFGVIAGLSAEAFVFRRTLSSRDRDLLRKADTLYGIAAILVLITGFIRVYFLGKGEEYYYANAIFLTKLGLFIIVGILSIYPTVVFLKWRKLDAGVEDLSLDKNTYQLIRRLITLELLLVLSLPILAAMMARGMGM
jgi:putative membrane protein